jgi:hypothetical protein
MPNTRPRAIVFQLLNERGDIQKHLLRTLTRGRTEFNYSAEALADVFCRLRAVQKFHAQTDDAPTTEILQKPRAVIHRKIQSLQNPWYLGYALAAAIELHRGDAIFRDDPEHPASQFGMAAKTKSPLIKIPRDTRAIFGWH